MEPYKITFPVEQRVPILLSVPHCGVAFPDELKDQYDEGMIASPDDTDWHVDQLYDFASSMGITMISAVYSRWVIDLNRDPQSKPLYTDGRIITALCPTTDFFGNPIYKDKRKETANNDVALRLELYYYPYHKKIQELLDDLKLEFGKVVLWDCHSIRQFVPTINKEKFPDLILGDADGTSASPGLIEVALKGLESGMYQLSHNHPFKGGYITRHFGKPIDEQHALQLEMSKVMYMDDAETNYDEERVSGIRIILKTTFEGLAEVLSPSPPPLSRGRGVSEGRGEKPNTWSQNKIPDTILFHSREMRKNSTEAENLLWANLRNRKLGGFKFRRQQHMEGFILDFYCHESRLGVEVDGEIHNKKEQKEYDEQRTKYLEELGIEIIRFKNDDVIHNMHSVLNEIRKTCQKRVH